MTRSLRETDEHIAVRTQEYGGVARHNRFSIEGAAKVFLNMKKSLDEVPFVKTVGQAQVALKPVGVAGLITPWNSAVFMVCNKVAPALAAGCTVVVKPSELSALQTQLLMECFDAAGLPPGVINVVNGRGEVVGDELTINPDVAKVSFTGSTVVGKTVMRNAARHDEAGHARTWWQIGAHHPRRCGYGSCCRVRAYRWVHEQPARLVSPGTRILVPEHRLEAVKAAFLKAVPQWKVGDPAEKDTVLGPLVTEKQFKRVQGYIEKGIDEGAELLTGGVGQPKGLEAGFFVQPTVFVNVRNDMTIAREEIFGPVLSIITYKDDEDAIRIANDSAYGLQGWISTTNRQRGRAIADRIEAGVVMVNQIFDMFDEAGAPAGGVKESGIGREFGTYGLQSYLEPHAVFA